MEKDQGKELPKQKVNERKTHTEEDSEESIPKWSLAMIPQYWVNVEPRGEEDASGSSEEEESSKAEISYGGLRYKNSHRRRILGVE